ncbi:MAG TPA: TonB-dependent receptor [Candidatus Baltobacteraceae bacterium]
MVKFFGTLCVFALSFALAQAAQASTVTGKVTDTNGAPVAGAAVALTGPATYRSATDATGAFTIGDVGQGVYSVAISKAGYNPVNEDFFTVLAGASPNIVVTMQAINFTSLRTIASVRATGRGTFNTTPASVNVISAQTIQEQGATQVMKVLDETPGIVASLPQTGGNAAAPGAITFPNIRGALSYETATLIDGHPVSVGTFGDYVTTFLNPFMLQNVEVVKGPGVEAPEVNYAIGGTVNFETKDPTYTPTGFYSAGIDNRGSATVNFGLSNTVGKLGFVAAYSDANLSSATNNYQSILSPSSPTNGILNFNGTTGTTIGFNDAFPTPIVPGTISAVENNYNLIACCQPITSLYENRSELAKLRYKFSPASSLTVAYLGGQTFANNNANAGDITPSTFATTSKTYAGSIPNGSIQDVGFVRVGDDREINNEPIFEGDFRTTLGKDTLLARYYAAGIDRLLYTGSTDPFRPQTFGYQLYGNDSNSKQTFSGQTVPVTFFNYFNQAEIDRLKGYSFEYDHPFGNNDKDLAELSYDQSDSTTTSYNLFVSGPSASKAAFTTSGLRLNQSITLPAGSGQLFRTLLLRGNFQLNDRLTVAIANYFNNYRSTYPTKCTLGGGNGCTFDGNGFVFNTTTHAHYDGRVAVEYRPSASLALRLSAGSAIAPPYLALLSGTLQPISFNSKSNIATEKVNSGALSPETAFGYDLGADYRFRDGVTTLSGDVYQTNLFNHFITETTNSGQLCPANDPLTNAPTGCQANTPLFFNSNVNLNNARFQGLELSLRHRPTTGFGYTLQGALQKAYAYNLPPYFYCSTPGPGCTANTNLAIVAGQNFNGGGISGSGLSVGGFSNQNVPYAQGYGELSYRLANGAYAIVGETYFGKNNALNRAPFGVLSASVSYPLNDGLSLQLSGDNLTNQYPAVFPNFGGGLAIPLANGQAAATQANVLGPQILRVTLTKVLGKP